jgi:hypothetical protein
MAVVGFLQSFMARFIAAGNVSFAYCDGKKWNKREGQRIVGTRIVTRMHYRNGTVSLKRAMEYPKSFSCLLTVQPHSSLEYINKKPNYICEPHSIYYPSSDTQAGWEAMIVLFEYFRSSQWGVVPTQILAPLLHPK